MLLFNIFRQVRNGLRILHDQDLASVSASGERAKTSMQGVFLSSGLSCKLGPVRKIKSSMGTITYYL